MAEVKWIKITTDMFDNRKIKHLRKLPDGNSIVLIWVMLLTMAGRCNANGMIFLTENIPYTPKMLADELGFEENLVRLALDALERLNMIRADNFLTIPGWEEYQNIEGMDKIREQNRLRKQKQRENQKLLPDASRDCHVTVTECHATDKEEDIEGEVDIEGDKEKNNNLFIHDSEKNFFTSPENPEKPGAKPKFDAETLAAKQADYRAAIRKALTLGGEAGAKRAYDYERISQILGVPGISVAAIREELNAKKEDHVSA